jgi:hypothetical protein
MQLFNCAARTFATQMYKVKQGSRTCSGSCNSQHQFSSRWKLTPPLLATRCLHQKVYENMSWKCSNGYESMTLLVPRGDMTSTTERVRTSCRKNLWRRIIGRTRNTTCGVTCAITAHNVPQLVMYNVAGMYGELSLWHSSNYTGCF